MRSGRIACCADQTEPFAGPNGVADVDVDSGKMRVHRFDAAFVRNDDEVPPAAGHKAGADDLTGSRRRDRCAPRSGEVDPTVKAEPAWPKRRRDRRFKRPCQPDRTLGSGVNVREAIVRGPAGPPAEDYLLRKLLHSERCG